MAEQLGGRVEEATLAALPAACALEFIHTYSLVHDDLPSMDNDTLRRGRPTSHVVYGEGMAILAGDALLTEAFSLLAREPVDAAGIPAAELARRKLEAIAIIAEAAGAAGMVGGQVLDLAAARPGAAPLDGAGLREMHARKTGALIIAAALAGAVMAGARPGSHRSDRTLRAAGRAGVPDRRRHPRRRRRLGRPRQDAPARMPPPASRRIRRYTDSRNPAASRPRAAPAPPRRSTTPGSAASCPPSRAGWSARTS